MRKVALSVAAAQLAALIEAALSGEEVVIADEDGQPLVRLAAVPRGPFKFGVLDRDALGAGPDFLEPMDEDDLAAWQGRS